MFEADQNPQHSRALVSYSLKKHFKKTLIRSRDFRKTDARSVIMGSSVKVLFTRQYFLHLSGTFCCDTSCTNRFQV